MGRILFLSLGIVLGMICGEKKVCEELKGKYNWDYGTCEVRK